MLKTKKYFSNEAFFASFIVIFINELVKNKILQMIKKRFYLNWFKTFIYLGVIN